MVSGIPWGFAGCLYLSRYGEQTGLEAGPGGDDVDLAYVITGLVVPAVTVLGLWAWLTRSRAGAAARAVADLDRSELARTVTAVQQRLTELSGQLDTMSRDWEERDRRLTGQLNALLAMTERPNRFDLPVRDKPAARRPRRS